MIAIAQIASSWTHPSYYYVVLSLSFIEHKTKME